MNERINELRKLLRLTMEEFGKRLGVTRSAISNIESGKRNVTDQMVFSICREFNVDEIWLRTGKGEIFQKAPESELDALVKKYNLSDSARILIEKFVNLRPAQQDMIINFMNDVASALIQPASPITDLENGIDINAEVESYRRTLELQRKAVDKSSASNGSNDVAASKIS